ncbi:MAG: hypothetical protein GYA46_04085 [candidate division Zixibacteria bacterium]|nr:hypothetical protein [candidate division Zixibacteria bacterium]
MKRQGLALGLVSVGGQVLLLRELVGTLSGDELFIGTALFGWLLAVAGGAFLGGRASRPRSVGLFIAGVIALPVMIGLVRLSPLAFTPVPGEIIPFGKAAFLSIIAMAPVGIISGWLFPVIVREGDLGPDSIVTAYFFEGIGAFLAGTAITVLSAGVIATLMLALVMGTVAILIALWPSRRISRIIVLAVGSIVILSAVLGGPPCDRWLEAVKYTPYRVMESFDTPYGRQTILSRDKAVTLMTDNAIEAAYPDRETAEYQLLPPLLYHPEAKRVLFIGRAEFGLGELAASFPDLSFAALDRRGGLHARLAGVLPEGTSVTRIDDDPVRYFSRLDPSITYDIIILAAGEPGNYQISRLYGEEFLALVRSHLKADGILFIPTGYDTDRYLGPEKTRVLAIIAHTLGQVFPQVDAWSGNTTLFFASVSRQFDLLTDSVVARSARLPISPDYVNGSYLPDRLEPMKRERLRLSLAEPTDINALGRPILPHYQALYRAAADSWDRKILGGVLNHPRRLMFLPVVILLFLACTVRGRRGSNRFPLFLFFVAGLISMSAELVSFYLFQAGAGSLYSEMAVLIGSFMLGLAVGTYYAHGVRHRPLEQPALVLMAISLLIFISFHRTPPYGLLVVFHGLFLFTMALATGALFVGATYRYYSRSASGRKRINRGSGYGWELVGSGIGALVTTTLLLPTIGLHWLLWSLMIVVVLAMAGSGVSARQMRVR